MKMFFVFFIISLIGAIAFLNPGVGVSAFDPTAAACGTGDASASPVCSEPTPTTNPALDTIKTAVTIVSIIAGTAAVILVIVGGISYITAAGNQQQAANARRRILGAAIGLVITVLAWSITTLVIDKLIN